jgi:hypothetical protein
MHFMKRTIITSIMFIQVLSAAYGQAKERNYSRSYFSLELNGAGKGIIKPLQKNDTLIYSIRNAEDSSMIRRHLDSVFLKTGKRYIIKYRLVQK